ncbi:MAG: recombinase family protein [Clostridiales bacterium]|nr:recombinase family protein [Clostridiales bacterium]
MIGYAKIRPNDEKESVSALFQPYRCEKIIIDDSHNPKAEDSIWQRLKQEIFSSDDRDLIVDSLFSLGKTGREISKELEWAYSNNIKLYIITVPSTFENQPFANKLLVELYRDKASLERKNVAVRQAEGQRSATEANVRFGRPTTPYPANWEKDYAAWRNKELTTNDFMERSKLKKGTFYNLIKRYKNELSTQNQDTKELV